MPNINLSEKVIPNTSLEKWVESHFTKKKIDYGIEYISEIMVGRLKPPKAHANYSYTLPPGVDSKHVEDAVRELVEADDNILNKNKERTIIRRVSNLKNCWIKRGQVPWSIKHLNQLRHDTTSPYYIDILEPTSYSGEKTKTNGIPYSSPFVGSLAYLIGSVISAGDIGTRSAGIWPSNNLSNEVLEKRLVGCITNEGNPENGYNLKTPYIQLLTLVGIPRGRIVDISYDKLGLEFIEDIVSIVENKQLSYRDYQHAKSVIAKFVQGVTDHRLREHHNGQSVIIQLPLFSQKDTAEKFLSLFERAFRIDTPDLNYNAHVAKGHEKHEGGKTYHQASVSIYQKYKQKPRM